MAFTHDIFISYGHLDDVNPFGSDKGWVDLLHERLHVGFDGHREGTDRSW